MSTVDPWFEHARARFESEDVGAVQHQNLVVSGCFPPSMMLRIISPARACQGFAFFCVHSEAGCKDRTHVFVAVGYMYDTWFCGFSLRFQEHTDTPCGHIAPFEALQLGCRFSTALRRPRRVCLSDTPAPVSGILRASVLSS
ncbi:unnamed protein product [Effrenium voratum]|uniref:Uncharacterized protein n=1 Tax=Effrenium voratum TaxID=2562239 RepID=A0AA36I7A1_9DINO|nr:unnamed protein product [Effrenium voratum]